QAGAGFAVAERAPVARAAHGVGDGQDGVHAEVGPRHAGAALHGAEVFAVVEGGVDHGVDEGVEAFVHPGVFAFVVPDDHREPVVPELVAGYAPEAALPGAEAAEDDTGVFHPPYPAGHVGGGGIGERGEVLGGELDGALDVLGG